MMRAPLFAAALLLVATSAIASPAAKITYLNGTASGGPEGKGKALAVGSEVALGDTIATGPKSRVELTMPDGSRLRLSANARLTLSEGKYTGEKRDQVSVKLWAGSVWAKVVKASGGAGSFEVETKNAVSGVRGTSFTVLASSDTSALVRVYSGSVGVRPAAQTGPRRQIPGPQQIDKRQWEEIIATAMKQVRVSQAGEISPAEDFEDKGDSLEWAQWNQGRDASVTD